MSFVSEGPDVTFRDYMIGTSRPWSSAAFEHDVMLDLALVPSVTKNAHDSQPLPLADVHLGGRFLPEARRFRAGPGWRRCSKPGSESGTKISRTRIE